MATESTYAPIPVKFLVAATSGVGATCVSYPFELLKNRMQMSGEAGKARDHASLLQFTRHIFKHEGFLGFYSGFSAAALRQVLYTGTRMGLLQVMMDHLTVDGKPPSIGQKLMVTLFTGAVGAATALPADVAMIRMALDNRLPPEKRRNYTGAINAITRIYKEEGGLTWFRGFTPTIIRAMVVNASQVVTYMQVKEVIRKYDFLREGAVLHVVCSSSAALVQTICSQPFDIAKTRLQNMKKVGGKLEYSGVLDVWGVVVKKEGFISLWKGFIPYFVKNGPQAVIFYVLYEKLFVLYKKLFID